MASSRLEKYKEYRDSSIKDDTPELDLNKSTEELLSPRKNSLRTTSTLPIDEVMKKIDENSNDVVFLRKQKTRHVLKIVFTILGVVALVAAMIILGIILWGNN